MPLALTPRAVPELSLEADVICPDRIAGLTVAEVARLTLWHGKERVSLGDVFTIEGTSDGDVRIDGDLTRVTRVGMGMGGGRLQVTGGCGMHAGARMRGGEFAVGGDVGDWAGAEMSGGSITVGGDAGRGLGAAYAGSPLGMRGGTIVVQGHAGDEVGLRMRRGVIGVGGRVGEFAGFGLLAGTIIALGGVGAMAGAGMLRGSIVSMRPMHVLPTFTSACSYRPSFLPLYLRHLSGRGLAVSTTHVSGRYRRWSGDAVGPALGELLVLECES